MLKKISSLDHIGRFAKLRHRAEPLKSLALVFARNGMGKSTMCSVLRAAKSQESRPIAERAHRGQSGPQSAVLEFDGVGTVAFGSGTWSRTIPPMMIFDQEFVRANVHAAEEVTRQNKRSLFRIIIGESGVALARAIAELDRENKEVNAELKRLELAIKQVEPSVQDVTKFANTPKPEDIATKIEGARRQKTRAQGAAEIRRRSAMNELKLPDDMPGFLSLLKAEQAFEGESLEEDVALHIAKHSFDERGARWLQYGVEHANSNDCPFCDQPLERSPIFDVLRNLFGPKQRATAAKIDAAREALRNLINEGPGSLVRIIEQNQTLFDYWSKAVEISAFPSLAPGELTGHMDVLKKLLLELDKRATGTSKVDEDSGVDEDKWQASVDWLTSYEATVVNGNAAIAQAKDEEAPDPQAVALAVSRFDKLEALRKSDAEPLKSLLVDWKAAKQRHNDIKAERKAKQDALRTEMEATAKDYQADVNKLLRRFGTNFGLRDTKASFLGGGQPNTEYSIDIDGFVLPAGESAELPEPSFRTALSAGDKSSFALALFIAQAERRADLAESVLVFDDPFNSQDGGRQFETAAAIRRLAGKAKQVIVLSHDPRFLNLLLRDSEPQTASEHQLVQEAAWKFAVKRWSCREETKADYVRRAQRIREYAATGMTLPDSSEAQLVADIRVFVEEFLDQRFPDRFAGNTLLGAMCEAIAADPNDPLFISAQELKELNEFSRPDHHRGTNPPDPAELKSQCQKVVDILGNY